MRIDSDQKQEGQHWDCTLPAARSAIQYWRSVRPGAIRMSRLRERRCRGFRVFQIEVPDADIDSLIARGLLDRVERDDADAVERAIGGLLDKLSG